MLKNLFIVAALAACVSASAAPRLPRVSAPLSSDFNKASIVAPQGIEPQATSRAETVTLGYCGSPYSAYNLTKMTAGARIVQLTELPASFTKDLANAELTAINICNPTNSSYKNTLGDITLVIYTDLNAAPVYTQAAKLGTSGFQYTKITLDTPFVVKGDTPVYFGYEFSYKTSYSSLYYIITDDGSAPAGHSIIGVASSSTADLSFALIEQTGISANCCITADATGISDIAANVSVLGFGGDLSAEAGKPFYAEIAVSNLSTEPLKEIEIACDINGVVTNFTEKLDEPLGFMHTEYVEFHPQTDAVGLALPMSVKVVAANGIPVESNSMSATIDVVAAGMGAKRTVVIEEGTGTWCGWCPMGYLMLEKAREKYENYIGIAVHSGDAMAAASYDDFVNAYFTGFPMYVVNRFIAGGFVSESQQYNDETFDYFYNVISAWPAIATLDFETEYNSDTNDLSIDASTTFGLSGKGNYRLAIVLKEDSVGPYRQENYLYGTQGWGVFTTNSKPSLLFNDVARDIESWNGIAGSVPVEFEAGTPNVFNTTISAANVKGTECDVVLMLLNATNNSIEQAVSKHIVLDGKSGLAEITAAGNGAVEYFDLNGRRLVAPGRGVVIERSANGTRKIIL